MTSRLRAMRRSVCNAGAFNGGRSLCVQISRERSYPCQYIDTTRKAIDCATTLLLVMKLCSRNFVLYCRSRPKDDKSRHLDPHFEEARGGVEPWSMARWKALLFLSLTVHVLQGKTCQNSLWWVVPGEYFLVSTKLDTFCYPMVQTPPWYLPSF